MVRATPQTMGTHGHPLLVTQSLKGINYTGGQKQVSVDKNGTQAAGSGAWETTQFCLVVSACSCSACSGKGSHGRGGGKALPGAPATSPLRPQRCPNRRTDRHPEHCSQFCKPYC